MMAPRPDALDIPEIKATGTAKISGQGVAATITATALSSSPVINQVMPANPIANGTKNTAQRLASRTPEALFALEDSTSLIRFA